MKSLNKVQLIGHLASDPELRTSETGVQVATFPLAINRDWCCADGTRKDAVDYHRIIAFNRLADVCVQHLVKGSPVYVEGKLQNHSFDDKTGRKHYVTEIVLEHLDILIYKRTSVGIETNFANVSDEKQIP